MYASAAAGLLLLLLTALCAASDSSDRITANDSAAAAAVAAALPLVLPTPAPPSMKWANCKFARSGAVDPFRFDCAALRVPFCHAASPCASTETLGLDLLRRQTTVDATAPIVWIVSDTTDPAATASLMERVANLNGGASANVYALHMRLWNPPPSLDPTQYRYTSCAALVLKYGARVSIDSSTLDTAQLCFDWLRDKSGISHLNTLSLTNAASDLAIGIDLVRAHELQSNTNLYILAVGRASRVVQRYMATHPDAKVAGYIFDTPHPMQLHANQDALDGSATTRFLSGCDSDAMCRAKFANLSTTVTSVLERLYEVVDNAAEAASHCVEVLKNASYGDAVDLKPSHGVRRFFARYRVQSNAIKFVPAVLYRIHRCNAVDVEVLQTLLAIYDHTVDPRASSLAALVDRVVTYSEFWPAAALERDQLAKAFETSLVGAGSMLSQLPSYCVYTASNTTSCRAVYKRTPEINSTRVLTYPPPDSVQWAQVNASTGLVGSTTADVLILASRLSSVGSFEVSEQLYSAFTSGASSNQTAILVQTDSVAAIEANQVPSTWLFQLLGRFLTKSANPLTGKWYVNDLVDAKLQAGSPLARPAASTFAVAPVSVNFTVSREDLSKAFMSISLDPYDYVPFKSPGRDPPTNIDHSDIGKHDELYIALVGASGVVVLFLSWWFRKPADRRPSARGVLGDDGNNEHILDRQQHQRQLQLYSPEQTFIRHDNR